MKHIRKLTSVLVVLALVTSVFAGSALAAGDVTITVEDADGNAIEGASVELVDSTSTTVNTLTTGTDGTVTFSAASDDTYTVNVTHTDYQSTSDSLEVAGSAVSKTVTLDSFRTVDVSVQETFEDTDGNEVTEDLSSATVALNQVSTDADGNIVAGTEVVSSTTDTDGNVSFSSVSDGDYVVTVDHADYSMTLEEPVDIQENKSYEVTFDAINSTVTLSDLSESSDSGAVGGVGLAIVAALAGAALVVILRD